ncbi:hypothetical protein ZZ1p0125 [Acinetobacter phage ZZ1]|jgi:hypothetical protein|uniref:Uncharacterized protein n=2 Tax=Zedzedvirus zz1 TaxID=2843640 RepID=A0A410T5E9_9CAUD|nr:hypothetical protein ZZ1p0125 [Acinetobacter phage ZZ1]AFL47459.1 hypothetical protein ZZ1p0125 [Acinetobacter phage ZZ1]QAU03977.1 hypothetical protein Henu6_gp174 [Acinetobacter phage Henu6]
MKHTHEYLITGDTNDADYINTTIDYTPGDTEVFIKASEYSFANVPGVVDKTFEEFMAALIVALQMPKVDTLHNWGRDEYDDRDEAYKTVRWTALALYGIDLESDEAYEEYGDDILEEIRDTIYECIADNVPYGEFGIHTIISIESRPKSSKTVLFKKPEYWDWQKFKDNHNKVEYVLQWPTRGSWHQRTVYQYRQCRIKNILLVWNSAKNEWHDTRFANIDVAVAAGASILIDLTEK